MKQIRHGDVMLEKVDEIPNNWVVDKTNILAKGEATGHMHKLNNGVLLIADNQKFIHVENSATITHEEHETITIPRGKYKVTIQREYDPLGNITIKD